MRDAVYSRTVALALASGGEQVEMILTSHLGCSIASLHPPKRFGDQWCMELGVGPTGSGLQVFIDEHVLVCQSSEVGQRGEPTNMVLAVWCGKLELQTHTYHSH